MALPSTARAGELILAPFAIKAISPVPFAGIGVTTCTPFPTMSWNDEEVAHQADKHGVPQAGHKSQKIDHTHGHDGNLEGCLNVSMSADFIRKAASFKTNSFSSSTRYPVHHEDTKTRRIAQDFFASSCLRGEIFWLRLGCAVFIGGFTVTLGRFERLTRFAVSASVRVMNQKFPRTFGELRNSPYHALHSGGRTVKDEVRVNLLERLRKGERLVPASVGH